MIDMPQVPPPAYEEGLTQKLMQCGLRNTGFTVKYQDELQSIEIVIDREAGASAEHFGCIKQAAGHEIITFKQPELRQAYEDWVFEALKPTMLADAQAELVKHGALEDFPERSKFGSDRLFAEALERQCGMKPGSFFVKTQWGLIGQPKMGRQSKADAGRMSCLIAAILYVRAKGEPFKFGFIGNEAFMPEK